MEVCWTQRKSGSTGTEDVGARSSRQVKDSLPTRSDTAATNLMPNIQPGTSQNLHIGELHGLAALGIYKCTIGVKSSDYLYWCIL